MHRLGLRLGLRHRETGRSDRGEDQEVGDGALEELHVESVRLVGVEFEFEFEFEGEFRW